MGCQKEISKKADYVLVLKSNQGSLSEDVELFFSEQKPVKSKILSLAGIRR